MNNKNSIMNCETIKDLDLPETSKIEADVVLSLPKTQVLKNKVKPSDESDLRGFFDDDVKEADKDMSKTKYEKAIKTYEHVMSSIKLNEEKQYSDKFLQWYTMVYVNCAICYGKQNNWEKAKELSEKSVELSYELRLYKP
eukprot:UN29224